MLDELPGAAIARGVDPFAEFAQVFEQADIPIGNLECVVAKSGEAYDKPYVFRASPAVLPVLRKHLPYVSLANNHTGDYGHAAFLEQLGLLKQHGIQYFGGGKNCVEARSPLLIERNGIRIALLAYNDFKPRAFEAGPTWPGVAWSVDAQVIADIRAARDQHHADLVIPFMHWGWEYEEENDRQKELARLMIDNGADLVVGGHPHVTQGTEYYHGKLIVYSLGNFVFNGFDPGPSRTGWVLRVALDQQGLLAWDTVVCQIDDEGIPRLMADIESPSGERGSQEIKATRALKDSPLNALLN